jgi:hypothetical protein
MWRVVAKGFAKGALMDSDAADDDIAALLAGPAYRNTDGASADLVLAAIRQCAASWQPEARVIGNVRAMDIVRAVSDALAQMASPFA